MSDIEVHLTAASAISTTRPDLARVTEILREQAAAYTARSKSANTWKAYATDWRLFTGWCAEHDRPLYPDGEAAVDTFIETITLYITHLAHDKGQKASTIYRKLSSISVAYGAAGVVAHKQLVWSSPVTTVMSGVQRVAADNGIVTAKKKPLRTKDLLKLSKSLGTDLEARRDRAILLIMFAGAFRRSEIEGLLIEDFTEVEEGMEIRLRTSKTDQIGEGRTKGIPYGGQPFTCPVRAWQAWLKVYGHTEGPAFPALTGRGTVRRGSAGRRCIDGRGVAEMIQRRVVVAGLATEETKFEWGGHSPRRGFATEAYANDAQEREIMNMGGWTSTKVMRGYAEDGGVWKHNAAMKLGL